VAIFIPGARCPISGMVIESSKDAVLFPPFVGNKADPLYVFSDAVIHVDAFRAHPLAAKVEARLAEARDRSGPGKRPCFVCGTQILDHHDYLGLGHLVEDASHPLWSYNYAHFHRHCVFAWPKTSELVAELAALDQSGAWEGDVLKRLIDELESQWTPIRYREFHDVPRAFVVKHRDQLYFFDCPFDEARDEYGESFAVYRVSPSLAPRLDTLSWTDLDSGLERVGTIPVSAVVFDRTRRRAVKGDLFEKVVPA
jgi:hypothetical protein